MLSEADKERIRQQGFGKSGDIGGQPKKVYWTPDGREILAMPDLHEYTITQAGKTVTGTRDANLDKGWLLGKPPNPKLYCPSCDRWHDTQADIEKCTDKKRAFDAQWNKKAQEELKKPETDRITKLENDVTEIKGMFNKLLEKLNG